MFKNDHYVLDAVVKLQSPFAEHEADASHIRTKRITFTTTEHSAASAMRALENARNNSLVSEVRYFHVVPVEINEYDLAREADKERQARQVSY